MDSPLLTSYSLFLRFLSLLFFFLDHVRSLSLFPSRLCLSPTLSLSLSLRTQPSRQRTRASLTRRTLQLPLQPAFAVCAVPMSLVETMKAHVHTSRVLAAPITAFLLRRCHPHLPVSVLALLAFRPFTCSFLLLSYSIILLTVASPSPNLSPPVFCSLAVVALLAFLVYALTAKRHASSTGLGTPQVHSRRHMGLATSLSAAHQLSHPSATCPPPPRSR